MAYSIQKSDRPIRKVLRGFSYVVEEPPPVCPSESRGTYSGIETGRANIFDSDLVALKQIFDVDFAEFFEGIPTSRKLQHRGKKKEE